MAARALRRDPVLTARADGVMTSRHVMSEATRRHVMSEATRRHVMSEATRRHVMAEATRRLSAFAGAGADCLHTPLIPMLDAVAAQCRAVVPQPANVLGAGALTTIRLEAIAAAGVARRSLGSSLARAVHRTIHDASPQMFGNGRFTARGHGIAGSVVDGLLRQGSGPAG